MRNCFKYRIRTNQTAQQKAENWLSLCRQLYNNCLQGRIITYKEKKKSISQSEQKKKLPLLKQAFSQFKQVNSQTLQTLQAELKEILNTWLAHFREILLSNLNKNDTGATRASSKLKNILQKIQSTNFLISTTNVNPRLALEILMLEL